MKEIKWQRGEVVPTSFLTASLILTAATAAAERVRTNGNVSMNIFKLSRRMAMLWPRIQGQNIIRLWQLAKRSLGLHPLSRQVCQPVPVTGGLCTAIAYHLTLLHKIRGTFYFISSGVVSYQLHRYDNCNTAMPWELDSHLLGTKLCQVFHLSVSHKLTINSL